MSSSNVWRRVSLVLALYILGCLGLALLARHVVAEPSRPSLTQRIGWVVQDDAIFGDRIDMISADDGWVLKLTSDNARLYRWNGQDWAFFDALSHTQNIVRGDIFMLSATDGWVVLGGPLSGSSNLATSSIYRWNGNTWNFYGNIEAPNAVSMESIDMLSPSEGWASGPFNFGTIYYHWNGTSWELFKQNFSDFTGNGIDMVSSTDGWSIGDGIYHWNGTDWVNAGKPVDRILNAISMVSTTDGWIVGGGRVFNPNTGEVDDEPGVILRWNGTSWNEVPSPVDERLFALDMVSADEGWIVGDKGTILHWDGGLWSEFAGPSSQSSSELLGIDMLSSSNGWITGDGGVLSYETSPELEINVWSGAPGSFFTLSGSDYPANEEATVNVNGHDLGTITTDEAGAFSLILSTANADEGIYITTVSVNPAATIQFILDAGSPLRPQEGEATEISVPAGIALTEQLFLPKILR